MYLCNTFYKCIKLKCIESGGKYFHHANMAKHLTRCHMTDIHDVHAAHSISEDCDWCIAAGRYTTSPGQCVNTEWITSAVKGGKYEAEVGHCEGRVEKTPFRPSEIWFPLRGRFVKAALIGAVMTSANMLKQASSRPAGAIPIFHPDLFPIGRRHRKHGHTWFTAAQRCNCEPGQIKSLPSFAPWAFHG